MAMIEVKGLTFAYDHEPEHTVLDNISFSLEPGTSAAVIGASGCGKSTLCQILCGIIPHSIEGTLRGEVLIHGQDVKETPLKILAQTIGYMMQDPDRQLIASTVEDELAFGPENLALPPEEIRARVRETMEWLEISHLALENPGKLSGGQKQLTAAGAVLTMRPEILVFDEPMSHVDQAGRENMIRLIKKMKKDGKTILVVEHDYELLDFFDYWLVLEGGSIKAFGPPERLLAKGAVL